MPFPGELLDDRYRLDDRIAAGGMGEVWRATDTVLGRAVAVKTLLADYAGDAGFRTRFQHEARAMASLRHGGVAPVYDFGETADGAYLVMARVDGMPLNRWIAEHGPLTAEETMSIVARGARALAAAHAAGIVHRDVKPGNLIIEPDGNVVLVDFGVARSAQSVTLTGAREVVGTALYIAPEQVSKQATGPTADLYALGAVAYHCLAGQPPFLGDNPLAVAIQHLDQDPPPLPESVPAPVRELVATAMAKKPAERFPSAIAMAEAAEAASASLHVTPTTAPATDGMSANGPAATGHNAAAGAAGAASAATAGAEASKVGDVADRPTEARALAETAVDHVASVNSRGETAPGVVAGVAAPVAAAKSPSVSDEPAAGLHDPVANSRNNSPARGKLAALSALLLALVGLGTALVIINPFDGAGTPAPATSTPTTEEPKKAPNPAKKAPKTNNNAVTSEDSDDDNDTARPSRTTQTTEPATEEAEPTTTAPADESTTTTPTGEPETTTTAPAPDESGDEEVMKLQ